MLTVITLTRGDQPERLAKCAESVESSLPFGAQYKIIQCATPEIRAKTVIDEVLKAEFVAFVDDDDLVSPEALSSCLSECRPDLGMVFTDQVVVTPQSRQYVKCRKTYSGVRFSPLEIHHLAMINSAFVDPTLANVAKNELHVCIDWLVKGSAALRGAAVHVPIPGYYWQLNPNGLSTEHHSKFMRLRQRASGLLASYGGPQSTIPLAPAYARDFVGGLQKL